MHRLSLLLCLALVASCSGGGSAGASGNFALVEFLEAGLENIERNTRLRFVFSATVASGQNLPERVKIENVQTGGAVPNFSLAVGDPRIGESLPGAADGKGYVLNGNIVDFHPKLPQLADSSDAGFRPNGEYHVFLKSGVDSLVSSSGDSLRFQQEAIFKTNEFFSDAFPAAPPRVLGFTAVDQAFGPTDLSRLDPRPATNRSLGNDVLLQQGRTINPGAGAHPFQTINPDGTVDPNRWELLLELSEPVSPASVTPDAITITQIRADVLDANNTTTGAFANTPVSFELPLDVEVRQSFTSTGFETFIVVRPLHVLVDDARYRVEFDGGILGIDARKTFIGDNGLTGDGVTGTFQQETTTATAGQTVFPLGQVEFNTGTVRTWVNGVQQVEGTDFLVTTAPVPAVAFTGAPGAGANVRVTYNGGSPVNEVGGRGYEAEFLVFDRAAIPSERNLLFDPILDGIGPETQDLTRLNTSLYNPTSHPGQTVGFLAAFGTGKDGPLSVPNGGTLVLDTGDMPNAPLGNPFTVTDLSPNDEFNKNVPAGPRTYDSVVATEWELTTLTVPSSSTLLITGLNPALLRVNGLVQVIGTIVASGENGRSGSGNNLGGSGGPGGFRGGTGEDGVVVSLSGFSCSDFQSFLDRSTAAENGFPFANPGQGPGRGMPGGETYAFRWAQTQFGAPPTGGGGGSHGKQGEAGEDRKNVGGASGTPGPACSNSVSVAPGGSGTFSVKNSGVIDIRSQPGAIYGDREMADVNMGGSGGGSGGTRHHDSTSFGGAFGGGSGGGGGGSLQIFAADRINVSGKIDARGGNGGRGTHFTANVNWHHPNGAGGGGSGGGIALVSANGIEITGSSDALDTTGGSGGARPQPPGTCTGCNAGGDGGNGYIFLMDPDGVVDGLIPGVVGVQNGAQIEYDDHAFGVLTVSRFVGGRFEPTNMYTALFSAGAADPDFTNMSATDFVAGTSSGQRMLFFASGTKVDPRDPTLPDTGLEIAEFQIATVDNSLGTPVTTINSPLTLLNGIDGTPERDEFMRCRIQFEYDDEVQAAVGPFLTCERVRFPFQINAP